MDFPISDNDGLRGGRRIKYNKEDFSLPKRFYFLWRRDNVNRGCFKFLLIDFER